MKVGSVRRILSMKFTNSFIKFIFVGGLNTALTYLVFLMLLELMPYIAAYTVAYVSGILFSFFMNSRFVFQQKVSVKKLIVYPVVYLIQYGINAFALYIIVDQLEVNSRIALLIAIMITIPSTYLLSRRILKDNKDTNR